LPEAGFIESRRLGEGLNPIIIARFCLGGRDVADGLEQPSVIEPVYPCEGGGGLGPEPAKQVGEASAGGELDGFERAPRPSPDDLGLIEAVDALAKALMLL